MSDQTNPNQAAGSGQAAAADAQETLIESGHHAGGSAFLDAQAALSEQRAGDPIEGQSAASDIAGNTKTPSDKQLAGRGDSPVDLEHVDESYTTPPAVTDQDKAGQGRIY